MSTELEPLIYNPPPMHLSPRPAFIVLLLFALLPSCRKKEVIPPNVIAQVGDRSITIDDFKHYLSRNAGTELAQIAPEASSALLDQYIEEAIISDYAAATGMDVSAERVAEAVRSDPGSTVLEKRDQMRRQKLVSDLSSRIPQPTDEEVRAYFQQHPDEFRMGERVRARQILVHDEKLAQDLHRQLELGASFEDLSKKHSLAPNASEGGDIGFVGRDQLPQIFEQALFNLPKGALSRVIQTDSSFHIFRVEDHQPPGQLDLATAMPGIRLRLREEALNRELTRITGAARKKVAVRVLTNRLPFQYSGALPRVEKE